MTKSDPFEPISGARVETIATLGDLPEDKTLLIVDDDRAFLTRLARAMEGRGFIVTAAQSVAEGLAVIGHAPPAFAVKFWIAVTGPVSVTLPCVPVSAMS